MHNSGTDILTVTNIAYTLPSNIGVRFYYPNAGASLLNSGTITILPGNSKSFEVAYIGYRAGVYSNYISIGSNSINGYYRLITNQIITNSYDFRTTPTAFNTSVSLIGKSATQVYTVIPIFNTVEQPTTIIPVSGTITGSPAWTISNTGTNSISVKFNPNVISNATGTYVATATIVANGTFHSVTNTATVYIDHTINKTLGRWLSPASHDNSIVGVVYDMIGGDRYLTIGVGMGGEGTAIYEDGGDVNADLNNLSLGADSDNYPYWSKVYRIPFTGTATTYYSNDYVSKTTTATDYSSYFGEFKSAGSMFVVDDDGYGTLKVALNNLIEFTTSTVTTSTWLTLNNLTRAFHYYSDVDFNGRYLPLPAEYASPLTFDSNTTKLFTGFDYNTRDQIATTATSIVSIPS